MTDAPRPRLLAHLRSSAPRHLLEQVDRRLSDHAIRWVAAGVAGVTLLGAGAAANPSSASLPAVSVAAVRPATEVAPQPLKLPGVALPRTAARAAQPAKTPAPAARRGAAKPAASPARWLPTGTGMWLHEFAKTEGGNAKRIVAVAQRTGLSTLYVQTGTSKKGWVGTPALSTLLRETRGTGISVVAWDFPNLTDPVGDAKRMAFAARYRCKGCATVAAVAPDIETAAEGTNIGSPQVRTYYQTLRRILPKSIAILATVPWPSELRLAYPYAATAPYADAWIPMAYWYNRNPITVTRTSMKRLARYRLPIMPVGQGYDGRLDAPYLPVDPNPGSSVLAFLRTAKQNGAQAVSLWSWQTTGPQQWKSLARVKEMFPVATAR